MRIDFDIRFDYGKVKGSTQLHEKFKREFMVACSFYYPDDAIVIPYDVGVHRAFGEPDKIVRCGQEGVPDLIIFGKGWYLLLDTKTGRNKLQENQNAFKQRLCDLNDGFHKMFKINSVVQGLDYVGNQIGIKRHERT